MSVGTILTTLVVMAAGAGLIGFIWYAMAEDGVSVRTSLSGSFRSIRSQPLSVWLTVGACVGLAVGSYALLSWIDDDRVWNVVLVAGLVFPVVEIVWGLRKRARQRREGASRS